MQYRLHLTVGALLLSAACATGGTGAESAAPTTARATLMNAAGQPVGTATLSQTATGVQVDLQAAGLPAGTHAFHLHETGRCDPPDFKSAGGHFNPTGKQHGFQVPGGPHIGDMRNVNVEPDGTVSAERTLDGATLRGNDSTSLLRPGGTALVMHMKPDDYKSQPSGDAGDRIACGVVRR